MDDSNKRIKVFVAMSGGVDSSVAAALLVKAGYEVTGAYIINYNDKKLEIGNWKLGDASCWLPDYRDALRVAAKLGIPLLKLDFTKEYQELVLDVMFKEYEAGRTPNPDVMCNKFVKFGVWLSHARKLGFDYLATGHYARIKRDLSLPSPLRRRGDDDSFSPSQRREREERFGLASVGLLQAKDDNKDQTYFLHQLTQEQLQYVMFPIGEYTKPQVRRLAKKFNLPTAEKEESMGICFVGEVPMKEFLQTRIKPKPGNIVLSPHAAGVVGVQNFEPLPVVGQHDGLAFYTIGQRHLGEKYPISNIQYPISNKFQNSKPLFVVDKNLKNNELVVGFEDDPLLYKKEIIVTDVNWIGRQTPEFPLQCEVRLRHRQPLQKAEIRNCKLEIGDSRGVLVRFNQPQRAVTPGQFAVFYKKGECLGGGVIN